jgi:type I restriction enzyme S subunit
MPSEWREVPLSDVLDIISDKELVQYFCADNYVSTENLLPDFGGVSLASSLPSNGKVTKHIKGDILFSNIRTYFKKLWFANRDGGCSNDVIVFRAKDILCPKFGFYTLMDDRFIQYTVRTSKGTKMPRGDKTAMVKYPMLIPPLPEQKAIAHILGSLDDKIELNRKMNETLEAMAQAMFKSWFVDFDPVIDNALAAGNEIPDELTERAEQRKAIGDKRKLLPEEIRQLFPSEFEFTDELGWIPKGWRVKPVEKVIQVNPRVALGKGCIAPFADMKALPTSGFSISNIIKKPYSGGAKFNNGDILLARITPCLENGKTGIVDFLKEDEVGFGSTEFIVLRPTGSISSPYVACLARDRSFREHCKQAMVGSSGRQRVQNACFTNFYLAIPEKEQILEQFRKLTKVKFNRVTTQAAQSRSLATIRDTLLPKLLSGEIRIKDADKLVEK